MRGRVEALSRAGDVHVALEAVLSPAPDAVPLRCRAHERGGGGCTGCPLMPLSSPAQRALHLDALRRHHGLEVHTLHPAPAVQGYRWSVKRVFGGRGGSLVLGSYARGSHRVVSMAGCVVEHPQIERAARALEARARQLGFTAWDERRGRGELRAAWFKTDGARVVACIVRGDATPQRLETLCEGIDALDAVQVSDGAQTGNDLRGDEVRTLRGDPSVTVAFGEDRLDAPAIGFLQPNPAVAARCYEALLHDASGCALTGALAFDLYAGAGVVTRALRRRFDAVRSCEAFAPNAAALGEQPRQALEFVTQAVERASTQGVPALVIANPPRAGLTPVVCEQLVRLGAPRLHIMSCGPAGLARDLAALASAYTVESIEAHETLPHTLHVELVVRLVRSDLHAGA